MCVMRGLWTKYIKEKSNRETCDCRARRCDRQPHIDQNLLVDVDDRHQQREDERPDDEADDAERLHYQEPNPQGKLVRYTRGERGG
jgi:hypothetical protein